MDTDPNTKRDRKAERQQAAQLRAELRPLTQKIMRLEQDLARLETKKRDLETRLADTTLYTEANKDELTALLQQQGDVTQQLEQVEMDWLDASETLQQRQQEG